MQYTILIYAAVAVMVAVISLRGYLTERKQFNKGVCPKCNSQLKHVGPDYYDIRAYVCEKCDYVTWVSYRAVDKWRND